MVSKGSKRDTSPSRIVKSSSATAENTKASSSAAIIKSASSTTPRKIIDVAITKSSVSDSPKRSPSRRSNSPSRKIPVRKSPTRRSPSRKSPSRKSPSRKSPLRTSPIQKSSLRKNASKHQSRITTLDRPVKIDEVSEKQKKLGLIAEVAKQIIEFDSDSDGFDQKNSTVKPKATVRGRTRKLNIEYSSPKVVLHDVREVTSIDEDDNSYVGITHRVTRKSRLQELDKIVHLKQNEALKQRLIELSDEDDITTYSRSSSVRGKSEPKILEDRLFRTEFGGWFGALACILYTFFFPIILKLFCNDLSCSLIELSIIRKHKFIYSCLDQTAFAIYSCFALLVAILSALPVGGPKVTSLPNKQGKLNYRMNGIFVAIVIAATLIILEYFNINIISKVLERQFELTVSSLLIGVLISFYLYIRSFFVPVSALNPYAITNSKVYNFWVGREINPRVFNVLDMKLFFYRIFAVGSILLNGMLLYENIQFSRAPDTTTIDFTLTNFNPTVVTICLMQIVYALDCIIFEYAFTSTFEVQYEGVGFMTSVLFMPSPFVITSISRYVYDYGIQLPVWNLVAAVILFLIGYSIYRGSNLQKHAFRQNPYNPALSHLESIPTSQGKKLLISGYWGIVRHPNYLGDILVFISFSLFVLNVPPVIVCLLDIVFLFHRSHRDGVRCKQRYGSAWDRYCQHAKYVLIPKVY